MAMFELPEDMQFNLQQVIVGKMRSLYHLQHVLVRSRGNC